MSEDESGVDGGFGREEDDRPLRGQQLACTVQPTASQTSVDGIL